MANDIIKHQGAGIEQYIERGVPEVGGGITPGGFRQVPELPAQQPTRNVQQIEDEAQQRNAALPFWDGEIKNYFNSLPDKEKALWLRGFSTQEKFFNKSLKKIKLENQAAKELLDILAPYWDDIKRTGQTAREYIENMVLVDAMMTNYPVDTVVKLIGTSKISPLDTCLKILSTYGYTLQDLNAAVSGFEARVAQQQAMTPLNEKISQIEEAKQREEDEATQFAQEEEMENLWSAFCSEVDENGNLRYPYAEDMLPNMKLIAEAYGEDSLHNLYNKAIDMHNAEVQNMEPEEEFDTSLDRTGVGGSVSDMPSGDLVEKAHSSKLDLDESNIKAYAKNVLNQLIKERGL